ncbi:MAG: hypothetical protein ACREMA_16380 [Longimicrobiales bacterium]
MIMALLVACSNDSVDDHTAQGTQGARMEQGVMLYDDAMKQRHADEADAVVTEAQAYIAALRTAGAAQWSKRTGQHADMVVRITSTVDRQMRERDMGMNMADERNGEAMGISGAEYRRMREQLRALRAEAKAFQNTDEAEVRQRMGPHLEQLEEFVAVTARSATYMRSQVRSSGSNR